MSISTCSSMIRTVYETIFSREFPVLIPRMALQWADGRKRKTSERLLGAIRWEQRRFVLDAESFRLDDKSASTSKRGEESPSFLPSIALQDVTSVKRCLDPSLPAGHAFWLGLSSRPQGLYFVVGKRVSDFFERDLPCASLCKCCTYSS